MTELNTKNYNLLLIFNNRPYNKIINPAFVRNCCRD